MAKYLNQSLNICICGLEASAPKQIPCVCKHTWQ